MRYALTLMLTMGVAAAAHAESISIATFEDPSSGGDRPLFSYNAGTNQLSGGWIFPGLTLHTLSGDFNNVTFSMAASPGANTGEVGAGNVRFFNQASSEIFRINFDSGQLMLTGFGATEFLATNDVTFSGSILPFPVSAESFSFGFANQVAVGGNGSFTASAAFTSSAVPEPTTVVLMGLGGFFALRMTRRKRYALAA